MLNAQVKAESVGRLQQAVLRLAISVSLQATHSQFRLPGDLKCLKCNKAGVLTSNGLRPGTRTVYTPTGQEKVFSQGMTHVGCPGHGGKGMSYVL